MIPSPKTENLLGGGGGAVESAGPGAKGGELELALELAFDGAGCWEEEEEGAVGVDMVRTAEGVGRRRADEVRSWRESMRGCEWSKGRKEGGGDVGLVSFGVRSNRTSASGALRYTQ